jgi:hypothetical protein
MDKGIVVLAQNTEFVDYVKCAEMLAYSIKQHMPDTKVSLITDDVDNSKYFDNVIALPYGDQDKDGTWKLINDWQVYEASPYEYTIKLEADMFLTKSIDPWWDVLKHRDLVVSSTIRNFKQEISTERFYRRFIDENKLPDCYNAITYFKKSDTAEQFFKLVRHIFENWNEFRATLKCNTTEPATTDWVYALAAHIIGKEKVLMPEFTEMSMVHMKQFINSLPTDNWTDTLIYEILPHTLRINTYPQLYPLHYHVKNFCDKLEKAYE